MSRDGPATACAVAIMAKASVAGAVKTRLVPPLRPQEAAELNTCCLGDVAAAVLAAADTAPIAGFAAYEPAGAEAFFRSVLPARFGLLPPREPTLAKSLLHAARDLFAAGWGMVCLINSDSPDLPPAVLVEAVRRLQPAGDRVVLGPAADGGYYLIGLKRPHARLFEDIDWSTARVFSQTLARAAEIGLESAVLPVWYDIDDAASLVQLWRQARDGAAPRTRALLGRLLAENPAVRRLLQPASE
jgi:rSAM/selenodomain-associated transferase 1